MSGKELERPLYLDMDFTEALTRYGRTKPDEVTPAPGQKRKTARPPKKTGDPSSITGVGVEADAGSSAVGSKRSSR